MVRKISERYNFALVCVFELNFFQVKESLKLIEDALPTQRVALDVYPILWINFLKKLMLKRYPYIASSTVLMITEAYKEDKTKIVVTWSKAIPEASGRELTELAKEYHLVIPHECAFYFIRYNLSLEEMVEKLQPAGAVYFCMDEEGTKLCFMHFFF